MQGESSADTWELASSLGHTTLTVGSGADCTWVVREEGVRPLHFSLHWDGSTLRVADVYNAGDVRVDGALLTSQWRPLLGRVRIDFGNAALVVETSSGQARSEEPGDPGPLGRAPAASAPRKGVETLIGVAPLANRGPQQAAPVLHGYVPGRPPSDPPPGELRAASGRQPDRNPMKATLVGGIAVGETHTVPVGSAPPNALQVVDTTGTSSPASSAPKPNATLMGYSAADALRGAVGTQPAVRVGTPASEEPRPPSSYPPAGSGTASGYPGARRMTQQGVVAPPPQPEPAHGAARSIPPAGERINSAWQESPEAAAFGGAAGYGATLPGGMQSPQDRSEPPRRMGERDLTDRLSDIPTQMRDPTTFSSRRPQKGVPWRYVGVLLLTAVAYFAWLYLLDHL